MKWYEFINIDTIAIALLVIAVIYCFLTSDTRHNTIYEFQGLGESGWNISEGSNFWDYGVSRRKTPQKHRKKNKHEERCREIFQDIYGEHFKSVRPDWLKNPITGKNLELDGFCPKIRTPLGVGLAFEYDGSQHSKYNKHFHRSGPDEFLYQTKKDSWKDIRCKQQRVYLVRIPHFVAYEDLERYITDKLNKNNLLPRDRHRSQEKNYHNSSNFDTKYSNKTGFLSGLYT